MSYSSFSKATLSEQEDAGFLKMTGCASICKCFDHSVCVGSIKTAFKRDKYGLYGSFRHKHTAFFVRVFPKHIFPSENKNTMH